MSNTILMSLTGASLLLEKGTHGFTQTTVRPAQHLPESVVALFCSSSVWPTRKRIVCGVGGIVVIVVFFQLTSFSPSQLISALRRHSSMQLHISSCASHTDIQNRNTADRCLDARLAIQLNEISGLHCQQLLHSGICLGQLLPPAPLRQLDFLG